MKLALAFTVLLSLGHAHAEENYEDLISESLSAVKEGLKTYPDAHLHFASPPHPDFSRMESSFRQIVLEEAETFLRELIERGQQIKSSKEQTINKLSSLVNGTDFQDESSLQQLKKDLHYLMTSMLQEMNTGDGSLDFELDNLARTGLGDIYLFIKSQVSEARVQLLKECPSQCGFSQPQLVSSLTLLRSSKPEKLDTVLNIILGLPGLDTKFIRPQLVKVRPSLETLEDQDFVFLVSLGEWLNDVLNGGLIVLQRPFGEIRGKLTELLGSSKDEIVPALEEILTTLAKHQGKLFFLSDELNLIVRKYFGQF